MIKFPFKTDLDINEDQKVFAETVAAELTRIRGSQHKVPTRVAWRLFNDCCRANPAFFWAYVSTNTDFSIDEILDQIAA